MRSDWFEAFGPQLLLIGFMTFFVGLTVVTCGGLLILFWMMLSLLSMPIAVCVL